jgi:DNA-binding CsgD family transcriptional regulator
VVEYRTEPTEAQLKAVTKVATLIEHDVLKAEQRLVTPALVLLNESLAPISYNEEAIRILTYPHDAVSRESVHIEETLEKLLEPLRSSRRTSTVTFQSGKREYGVRIFTLSTHRKDSSGVDAYLVTHALLLERQERRRVDLSLVTKQFHLTPREQQTLGFLLQGMTSKEIADRMEISPHTVKAFLRLVMSKMQVSTRSGIIGKIVSIAS